VKHHLVGAAPELRVTGRQNGGQHSQLAQLGKEVHPPLPCRGVLLHKARLPFSKAQRQKAGIECSSLPGQLKKQGKPVWNSRNSS